MDKNYVTLLTFADENIRATYRKIVEQMLNGNLLLSTASTLLAAKDTYEKVNAQVPLELEERLGLLYESAPVLKGVTDPREITEAFSLGVINSCLQLAMLLITSSTEGKVSFSNIHHAVTPLLFDDDEHVELSVDEMDNLIDELSRLSITQLAEA